MTPTSRTMITDHFLRRFMDRVWGINIENLCWKAFKRKSADVSDDDFIEMLRSLDFDVTDMKRQITDMLGENLADGDHQMGAFTVVIKTGKAVTLFPRRAVKVKA